MYVMYVCMFAMYVCIYVCMCIYICMWYVEQVASVSDWMQIW